MLERFVRWIAPDAGIDALDVGTGPGLLPALLARAGCRALGVDSAPEMFRDALHPNLILAEAASLPFRDGAFHLVCASNLLFLLPAPLDALREMTRVLRVGGEIALLNPSERMSVAEAESLADARGLQGLARATLVNYAARAEQNFRWDESALREMFSKSGLQLTESATKMGKGLVRFARALKPSA